MSSHGHDLKNPKFCNWVKGGTALKYFTEGLKKFVDGNIQTQHQSLLNDIETELRSLNRSLDVCDECSVYNILPCSPPRTCQHGKDKCRVHSGVDDLHRPATCRKGTCRLFYDKIKDRHQTRKPSWRNTTAQKWCSHHIEIAKCFLSECEANERIKSIDDVDTIGLLDIIENNTHIENCLSFRVKSSNNVLYKCKLVRNAVFHTENFELSDDDVDSFIKDLVGLLEDRKHLCSDPHAQAAVLSLKQLADGNMVVTLQDELKVREEVLKQIQLEKAHASANVKDEQVKAVSLLRKELQENMKEVNEQYQSMSLSMFAMKDNFESMGLAHSLQFQSINDTQERIKQNLTELSKTVKGEVKELIIETLDDLQQEKKDVKVRVKGPQDEFEVFNEQMKQLDQRVNILEQSFDSMKQNLNKFERLEQLHKQDMARRHMLSDYLKRKYDLQEELCQKYSKRRASVNIPFHSDIPVDVVQIHTNQNFQATNFLGSVNVDSFSNNVGSYTNILSKDGTVCQKIVLLGNVGYGKTIYCYRLLHDWVRVIRKVQSKKYSSLGEEDRFLSKFSFVFYIELEHAVEDSRVIEMICRQIFGSSIDMFKDGQHQKYTTILEVFEKEPSECLIILDGLDKWNPTVFRKAKGLHNQHLPIQPFSGSCATLITCRPWKWHAILHSLTESDVDNTHHVCEFAEETEAAQKLIKVFSNKSTTRKDETSIFDKFDRLSSEPVMNDIMKVPTILHFLVWTMFNGQGFCESKTELISKIVIHLFEYMYNWECGRTMEGRDCSLKSNTEQNSFQQFFQEYLPKPLGTSDIIGKYQTEISKLALLAFKDLFNAGDQSPLLLTEQDMRRYFQKEELELCLKTGILTQERVTGCNLQRTFQFSFLCSTLQHYFAALHLALSSSNDECESVDELLEFLTEERLYEIENFLIFAFCMVPGLCKRLTKSVCAKRSDDPVNHKPSDRMKFLLLKCLEEADAYNGNTPQECSFYLESMGLSVIDFKPEREELSLRLYQGNACNLKHLVALTDATNTISQCSEQKIEEISRLILNHLSYAVCLVKLNLSNISLVDGGSFFTYLGSLKVLSLDNIKSKKQEVLNLTCSCLKMLKCTLLENMQLKISSTVIKGIDMKDCHSVQLKAESAPGYFNLPITLGLSQKMELKDLKSMVFLRLRDCFIDFQDASMNMDKLELKSCSDCELLLDQNQVEEDDKESSNDSSLYSYLPDFSKILTQSITTPMISSIQRTSVTDNCTGISIRAFTIVSSCLVENSTDSEVIFQSNVKDKDAFAEESEKNASQTCLQTVEVKNVRDSRKRSIFRFSNMPLQLTSVSVSDCCNCGILMDCFDDKIAMTLAKFYFIETRSVDLPNEKERTVYLNHVNNSDIFFKNTRIALTSANVEFCENCTVTFEQNFVDASVLENVFGVPGKDMMPPLFNMLKCIQVSNCRLQGLEEAVIRKVILESCEIAWSDIQLNQVQSLHIENVPESAAYIFRSLKDSRTLQNIVCQQLTTNICNDLQTILPTLLNLTSVDISQNAIDAAPIIYSLTGCKELVSLKCRSLSRNERSSELENPKNLEMRLKSSSDQTDAIVFEAFPKFENLKELEFTGLSEKALLALKNLDKKLSVLEHFTISQCPEGEPTAAVLTCVAKMPKLKKLTCREIPADILSILRVQKLKHLETFEVGPILGQLDPRHLGFLLNVPKLKKPFKIICNRLRPSISKVVMDVVFAMRTTAVCVEICSIVLLDKTCFDGLKPTGRLKSLVFRDVKSDLVITALDSLHGAHLECLHLENIEYVANRVTLTTHTSWEINIIKLSKIGPEAMKHLIAIFEHSRGVNTVDLSCLALEMSVIQYMTKLKPLKELKLHGIHVQDYKFDLEPLERCIGILDVQELTLSDVSFRGSVLNLSNAYRLKVINLANIYMHPNAWIKSFELLPKLLDARERGIVSEEFVLVDHVERKHSTSVQKVKLQNVCITGEVIRQLSGLSQFPHANWTCVREGHPAIYNGDLRSDRKK